MLKNHNVDWVWVQTSNTPAYQLQNESGIKVWLTRANSLKWWLYIGDEFKVELPRHLDEWTAKRIAVGRTIGYLRDLISQLERFTRR